MRVLGRASWDSSGWFEPEMTVVECLPCEQGIRGDIEHLLRRLLYG